MNGRDTELVLPALPDQYPTPEVLLTASPDIGPPEDNAPDLPLETEPTNHLVEYPRAAVEELFRGFVEKRLPSEDLQGCAVDSLLSVFPDKLIAALVESAESWPPPEGTITSAEYIQVAEAFQVCAPFVILFDLAVPVGGASGFTDDGAVCIRDVWDTPDAHMALALNAVYGKTALWTSIWEEAIALCRWEAFYPALRNIAESAGVTPDQASCAADHANADIALGIFAQPTKAQTDNAFSQWGSLVTHCANHG